MFRGWPPCWQKGQFNISITEIGFAKGRLERGYLEPGLPSYNGGKLTKAWPLILVGSWAEPGL